MNVNTSVPLCPFDARITINLAGAYDGFGIDLQSHVVLFGELSSSPSEDGIRLSFAQAYEIETLS